MRTIDIGASDTVVLNITRNGTSVMQILPPTATASLPAYASVPKGTIVYDSTTNKLKVAAASAYETVTSS